MAFNLENKVTFNELAPSLQQLIRDKATIEQYNTCNAMLTKLTAQLGANRISIANSGANVANPQNDREILVSTANNTVYSYHNAWKPTGGVYS
jgi:hypothetical protein